MRRPSLRDAVAWIALNDNSGNGDTTKEISEYVTTALIADIFGTTTDQVATKVARVRRAEGLEVAEP